MNSPAGEFTYVYQIHNTGTDVISSLAVALANPADNIGSFSDVANGVTGVSPSGMSLTTPGSAYWQFFTYMWLHGGMLHLTFNMFFLFIFGEVMEHALGTKKYLSLYIVSGLGSALFYILLTGIISPGDSILLSTEMLGASGAVFGVMAAYGLMFPKNKIWLPFLLKPLPAITVVFILAALEFAIGYFALEPMKGNGTTLALADAHSAASRTRVPSCVKFMGSIA